MSDKSPIDKLTIRGFKSIRALEGFPLNSLNVLIGANGAGKSNFVSYFRMLGALVAGRLQNWVREQGSVDRIVSFGVKETSIIESSIQFGLNSYHFAIKASVDGGVYFISEIAVFAGYEHDCTGQHYCTAKAELGAGHLESRLGMNVYRDDEFNMYDCCYRSISDWKVFHFHDTSDTAGVKRLGAVHDNEYLRPNAANLAAYLYRLSAESPNVYAQIRKTVRLAIPFFDDFVLKPIRLPTEEEQIRLLWRQQGSDYPLWPSQLSDGSIRFICLVTALLQPDPPSTIIIDEPELGLHPYALTLLGSLLRSASQRMQVIVSTQSVPLVNEFSIQDLIVVEREEGGTVFKRHAEEEFKAWLEEYAVGELWAKNILGGRPSP